LITVPELHIIGCLAMGVENGKDRPVPGQFC